MTEVFQKLKKVVTEKYISNDIYVRHAYSRNVNPVLQGVPDIVIRPKDAKEISEILKIASEDNVPIVPRGGGCCEWGGSIVENDTGIILDMKRMNNVINLDQDNLVVTVEAGIAWGALNAIYMFPLLLLMSVYHQLLLQQIIAIPTLPIKIID